MGDDHMPGYIGDYRLTHVPDIIEFVTSDRYLNKTLYPRQATLLKTIFLQDELFTSYDYDVLAEWVEGFRIPQVEVERVEAEDSELVTTMHYTGDWGINPDVLDRIKILRALGHRWFSVICAVQGRRSGKGHIGAIAGAYVLWNYICASDPKDEYGIDIAKRLSCQVFAGKKAQARDNQWRDIANTLLGAPCFDPFISDSLVESMTIMAPFDRARSIQLQQRGMDSAMDPSSFEVVPKEATTMAARGPASFMQFYDEMAHMVATGVSRSAEEVWNSATPALDQFKKDAFIYCGSSPWTMLGKFYDLVQESLEYDAETYAPINPTILTIQLASWDIYVDWERTVNGDMLLAPQRWRPKHPEYVTPDAVGRPVPYTFDRPPQQYEVDGRRTAPIPESRAYHFVPTTYFKPLKSAIQEYDAKMRREERLNPETFAVERRAKWATAQDAYLPKEHVLRAFQPWGGQPLLQLSTGSPGVFDYFAHGDPGKTGSNFGFAVAHIVPDPDGDPIPHVVFDRVHAWTPGDFPTHLDNGIVHYEMNYPQVEEDIKQWFDGFLFTDLSFDQWNSISLVQRLGAYGAQVSYKPTHVWERNTTAPLNWATAETFKLALALNRVHLPYFELAELELLFLRKLPGDKVDHPETGPVTTKDVYDAISIVVHKLIGGQIASVYGEQFSALRVGTGMPGQQAVSEQSYAVSGSPSIADSSVHSMFNRDRSPAVAGRRPVPGSTPARVRPERR